MGKLATRQAFEFETINDFYGVGGAEAYGDGSVVISGFSALVAGGVLKSRAPGLVKKLTFSTYGDSTANTGGIKSPASNAVDFFDIAMPGAGSAGNISQVDKLYLPFVYPAAKQLRNCGTSGATLAQLVTNEAAVGTTTTRRIQDCAKDTPDVIFDRSGVNTFAGVLTENQYATEIANKKRIIDWLASTGSIIVEEGIAGYSNGLPGFSADANGDIARTNCMRANADIGNYIASEKTAGRLKNVFWLSPVGLTCDQAGAHLPGYCTQADTTGKHLSSLGAVALGRGERDLLTVIFGNSSLQSFLGENLYIDPFFIATSVVGHGTIPANVSILAGNCTRQNAKIETINGAVYSTCEGVVQADGDANLQFLLNYNPTAAGAGALNVVANDIYGFSVDFILENKTTGELVKLSNITSRLRTFDVTAAKSVYDDTMVGSSSFAPITAALKGQLVGKFQFKHKYNESAAAYGYNGLVTNNSHWYVMLGAYCSAGDVIKAGISQPTIIKNPD